MDAKKDAIMIDKSNLALELKNAEKLKIATTKFIQKSAFESITSIVGETSPEQAVDDGADMVLFDPNIQEPAKIREFCESILEAEQKITHRINQNEPEPIHKILEGDSADLNTPETATEIIDPEPNDV